MGMEVLLPQNGAHMRAARVIGLNVDSEGRYDANPVLNTQVYDVMFPDGAIQQYAVNIITENLLAQVDEDGNHKQMLQEIVDHRTNGMENTNRGSLTTKGHKLLVSWTDGTED